MQLSFAVLFTISFQFLVPLSFAITLEQLKTSALSVDDFLSMVHKDGRPMTIDDVYPYESTDNSTGEKAYISGGYRLATPDECSPRGVTVTIPRAPHDPASYIYWPECTMVKRCGGCCPSDRLICVPSVIEMTTLHVLRADTRQDGSVYLNYAGPLAVSIEQHRRCEIICRLTPADCQPYQYFLPEECKCKCNIREECAPNKVFDRNLCTCKCPEEGRRCNRNTVYDFERCRCVLQEEFQEANIAIVDNLSQADIDAYLQLQSQGEIEPVDTPRPTMPPTTPTTQATTTATPRVAMGRIICRSTICPPRWRKIIRRGRCLCQPRRG